VDPADATERLWRAVTQGRPIPSDLEGALDFDSALQVQLAVLERRTAAGAHRAGWKIGLTSERVRKRFGIERQPFAYLLQEGMHDSGDTLAFAELRGACGIEPELCWTLGAELAGPGATPAQARRAVGGVAAALEINEMRAPAGDFPLVIADGLAARAVVTGQTIALPAFFTSDDVVATLECDGEERAKSRGGDVIDDHFRSLAVLANALAPFGRHLERGDRIITGSFSRHEVAGPSHWRAAFSGVGTVEVRFR